MELCGGTHLRRTGEIGSFAVTRETAAAAGVRRIEAVAGEAAYCWWKTRQQTLQETAALAKVSPEELPTRVAQLQGELADLRKEIDRLRRGEGLQALEKVVASARSVSGITVAAGVVDAKDRNELRGMGDALRVKLKTGAGALAARSDKGCMIVTVVTDDLSKSKTLSAGDLASALAGALGGSGGGRAHLAEAGAKDCDRLEYVLDGFAALVEKRLSEG
jgi:alanyl-tRNA synthetase